MGLGTEYVFMYKQAYQNISRKDVSVYIVLAPLVQLKILHWPVLHDH